MAHPVRTKQGAVELMVNHLKTVRSRGGVDTVIITRGDDGVGVSTSFNLDEDADLFKLVDAGVEWVKNTEVE